MDKPLPSPPPAQPSSREVSLQEAMALAIQSWQAGRRDESATICRQILAKRPLHQGAKHLLMTIEHGVQGVIFTAILLNDPDTCDVGDYSYGAPRVFPHNQPHQPARLKIGKFCTIGHNVEVILGSYHRQDWFTIFPFSAPHLGSLFPTPEPIPEFSATRGGVVIGNDVWIGAHSLVLSGVTIGDGAVIGAGAVVTRDVGPYEVWAGNPATCRKLRFAKPVTERLLRIRWWDWPHPLVLEHAARICSGSSEDLAILEHVAHRLWSPTGLTGPGFCDTWVRSAEHRIRVRALEAPVPDRPTLLILHGSFGSIETVFALAPHLLAICNPVFCDLPGFGQSLAPARIRLPAFVAAVEEVLSALKISRYYLAGASFGGAVALGVAARREGCEGVALLDTPLSTQKLWHNQLFLRRTLATQPDNGFAREFAFNIYGVTPTTTTERSYFDLLERVSVPMLMVVGDEPLMPPREFSRVPCCVDEQDLHALSRSKTVRVARIQGGHDLVNDNTTGVAQVLREMISGQLDIPPAHGRT